MPNQENEPEIESAEGKVRPEFESLPPARGKKVERARCRHCGKTRASNITRMASHLKECSKFRRVQMMRDQESQQTQLDVVEQLWRGAVRLSHDPQLLDELAATAILTTGSPTNLFSDPMFRLLIKAVRPAGSRWMPPSRSTILDVWLPEIYVKTRQSVLERIIKPASMLNIVFDASEDTQGHRQVNISVATPERPAVFWKMVDTGSQRHTGVEMALIVKEAMHDLVEDQGWSKINAFATDTCNAALSACRSLMSYPELKHTYHVYCDSTDFNY